MTVRKLITAGLLLLATVLSCINTRFPKDVLLNHVGTVVILLLLLYDAYRRFLSYPAFLGIAVFCLFHILGARYVYSFVPYNEWSIDLFGWSIKEHFQFTRNHYDRFIHLIFGILVFPALVEYFDRKSRMEYRHALLFSWMSVQAFSMVYELIEWMVALSLSERSAENYNGQQGDVWDAHKDMALAMLGSTAMLGYYMLFKKHRFP